MGAHSPHGASFIKRGRVVTSSWFSGFFDKLEYVYSVTATHNLVAAFFVIEGS